MAWRCDVEMLATRVLALGISTPLVMLITAQAAQAQEYLAREAASARKHHAAPEAYDAQANLNYGFGPRVTVHPDDVLSGNRVSAAIRIPLSGARYCATITPAGLIPDRSRMSPITEPVSVRAPAAAAPIAARSLLFPTSAGRAPQTSTHGPSIILQRIDFAELDRPDDVFGRRLLARQHPVEQRAVNAMRSRPGRLASRSIDLQTKHANDVFVVQLTHAYRLRKASAPQRIR